MAGEPTSFVLDSFALLAYLDGEAGGATVRDLLKEGEAGSRTLFLSLINLGEILHIIEREQGLTHAQRTLAAIEQLPLTVEPVSPGTVLAAAHLGARYSLAYAGTFAAVAARDHGAVLVTGDAEFEALAKDGFIQVQWLPRK